jgi:hypothetical protein
VRDGEPTSPRTTLSTQNETTRESALSVILRLVNAPYLKKHPPPDLISGDYQPVESEGTGTPPYHSREILEQLERGNPLPSLRTLRGLTQAVEASFSGDAIDDRLHAFENSLDMLAKLDPEHPYVKNQSNHAIALRKPVIFQDFQAAEEVDSV